MGQFLSKTIAIMMLNLISATLALSNEGPKIQEDPMATNARFFEDYSK